LLDIYSSVFFYCFLNLILPIGQLGLIM